MKFLLPLLLALLSTIGSAAGERRVPEGFVLQPLAETDGLIARPKDWFFTSRGTPSGWLWTLSKEDPSKGAYQTGLRIQLLVGVAEKTGRSREAFVEDFVATKRGARQVMRDCPETDLGDFRRKCIEVLESVPGSEGATVYRILYTVMWGKQLDMVVVTTFGAPPESWDGVASTADAMSEFTLIGPNFGK